jgi:hypothetical protein
LGCQLPVRNTKFLIKNLFENNFEANDSDITFIKMTEKRQTSQGYIIRILQHFATKLWNITNIVMLF